MTRDWERSRREEQLERRMRCLNFRRCYGYQRARMSDVALLRPCGLDLTCCFSACICCRVDYLHGVAHIGRLHLRMRATCSRPARSTHLCSEPLALTHISAGFLSTSHSH